MIQPTADTGTILHATIPVIETERLRLRPFEINDAEDVRRLAGDREIADTTGHVPHPYEEGMAEAWISTHGQTFNERKGVTFAITGKSDGALVGAISLLNMTRGGHRAELGYWIGRSYWNRGFCTEAGHAVLRYAFSDLALSRVHAAHLSRNPASGRVMTKLGFLHEGLLRQHMVKWGKLEDLDVYGVLKTEWSRAGSCR